MLLEIMRVHESSILLEQESIPVGGREGTLGLLLFPKLLRVKRDKLALILSFSQTSLMRKRLMDWKRWDREMLPKKRRRHPKKAA